MSNIVVISSYKTKNESGAFPLFLPDFALRAKTWKESMIEAAYSN
jgi:hypothetical protein